MDENKIEKELHEMDQSFRDSIGTIQADGDRKWIFPKKPKGKYTNYRTIVNWLLIVTMFSLPFVHYLYEGHQLFMFNIFERKFLLFGFPFYPQDLFILVIGGITAAVFILLFTVVFGRVFCGWICPQTVFLEGVFRKIEYAIEGDRNEQMKLDRQEWDTEKIQKRILKYSIFVLISFLMSNIVTAYIIGSDNLLDYITEGPSANPETFSFVLINAAIILFVFAWFREQVCTLVCPYGRFQGVLLDKKTINVTYDYVRGEGRAGRASFRKDEDRQAEGKGDCIDCNQCVVVCPTGIDIRDGIQLECVNCTACIDACDEIMTKIDMPIGLIRYASEDNITKGEKWEFFTPRILACSLLLFFLAGIGSSFIFLRTEIEAKLLKAPGTTYFRKDDNIVNVYQYTFINKTHEEKDIVIKLLSHEGEITLVGSKTIRIETGKPVMGRLTISIPAEDLLSYKERIKLAIYDKEGRLIDEFSSVFSAPFGL